MNNKRIIRPQKDIKSSLSNENNFYYLIIIQGINYL